MATNLLIIVWADNSRSQVEFLLGWKEPLNKKLHEIGVNFAAGSTRIKGSILMMSDGHIAQYSAGETLEVLGLVG